MAGHDEAVEDGRPILESFARHLMVGFDLRAEAGFAPVADRYLARLTRDRVGDRRAIDPAGDLLVADPGRPGAPERRPLLPALAAPTWRDPATGRPLA